MLECRCCDATKANCDFKRDVLKALDMIGEYVHPVVVEEIEDLIKRNTDKCFDFSPKVDNCNE
jgi:hypothetical protein